MRDNDAVWARFYRDGKNLQEIAEEFGGTIYDYSPWLYGPIMQAGRAAENARTKRIADLEAALKRTDDHMRSFADYHPEERTTETEAIIWCNQELLR